MGCEQSNELTVVEPTKMTGYSLSQLPETLTCKPSAKNQINTVPNDQFHLRWFETIKQSITLDNLESLSKLSYQLFCKDYILESIELNKKIIEVNHSFNPTLEGLGNKEMSLAKYQWNVTSWYRQQVESNKMKLSHYDVLSLSFLALSFKDRKYMNELKRGLLWYQGMLTQNPESIPIMMGYANLFSCTDSYDQAIQLYDKVIQKDAYFKNAYISKAIILEYRRINLTGANEIATKINYLFQSDEYADFILARNINDIDDKIYKLKQASLKHPHYVRIMNQVGICYGAKKNDYDQAIEWYKKCVQIEPLYYSAYNNIGVNNELKKNYQEARKWYYKAIIISQQYAAPHNNLADVYQALNFTNSQIQAEVRTYDHTDKTNANAEKTNDNVDQTNDNVDQTNDRVDNTRGNISFPVFCWQIGTAFYRKGDIKNLQCAIYWHQKSVLLNPQRYDFWNSLGIAYDQLDRRQVAIEKYLKAIELNPQYEQGYYNSAIAYKALNNLDKAQEYYKKAVQINPKYSFAWNNLANLYKNKQQYEQATQYYQHAIQYNSTYTLALANLGICQLKLAKYKEAFATFSKAKAALPNDNNNLSNSNKLFLKEHLDRFDQEGQKWKQSGSVTDQQKQSLKKLIQQFENKFKNIAAAAKQIQVSTQKIFQPQILQIIKILREDSFELKKIEEIFQLISKIFHQDEEYFHIVPLLVIEKFSTSVFGRGEDVMMVEKDVKGVMEKIAERVSVKQIQANANAPKLQLFRLPQIKLHDSQVTNAKVNLFEDNLFFNNAEQLYIEINRINGIAKKSYTDFSLLVEETRKKSNGLPGGISTKIPNKLSEQFKVMLRIMEKLFQKEIDSSRRQKIITSINNKLKLINTPTLDTVVRQITSAWNQQITTILKQRKQGNIQTPFTISDLLRARCLYTSLGDLMKAIQVVDGYCKVFGYEIIELTNRLAKRQTQDVVFKIKIRNVVCELQLAVKQDQKLTHLDHCVYEILRSPLGVIFGSYLFMSKQVKYPFTTNCKDIVQKLKDNQSSEMLLVKQSAQYVLNELQMTKKQSKPKSFV